MDENTNKEDGRNSQSRGKTLSGLELHSYRGGYDREIPGRGGMKDYAPDGTWLQQKHLQSYHDTRREVLSEERVQILKNLVVGEWKPENKCVEIIKTIGHVFHHKGYMEDGSMNLYPEEALYLMDEASMEVYYGGIPLSVQQAYAAFLDERMTINHYHVYAHLSRAGYIVRRHAGSSNITLYERKIRLDQHIKESSNKKCGKEKDPTESETVGLSHKGNIFKSKELPEENVNETDSSSMQNKQKSDTSKCSIDKSGRNIKNPDDRTKNYKTSLPELSNDNNGSVIQKTKEKDLVEMDLSSNSDNLSKFCKDDNTSSHICDTTKGDLDKSVIMETEQLTRHCLPYTNWNFQELKFPNVINGIQDYILNAPAANLHPTNRPMFKQTYLLSPEVLRLNRHKTSRKSNQSSYKGHLEFSFGKNFSKRKSKARNWGEYKLEKTIKVSSDDDLINSPVGHLWCGDVVPLVKPQDASSTAKILEKLKVVENVRLTRESNREHVQETALKIAYDVYLPDHKFKKSKPGLPNHRIIVMRQEDPPPDLSTISHLSRQCKDGVPLHWAVVDNGDIAFYSFNDVDLPTEINIG